MIICVELPTSPGRVPVTLGKGFLPSKQEASIKGGVMWRPYLEKGTYLHLSRYNKPLPYFGYIVAFLVFGFHFVAFLRENVCVHPASVTSPFHQSLLPISLLTVFLSFLMYAT